jgi:putative colanic acid biosynthesis UDP-glucose lipid carrier transferase
VTIQDHFTNPGASARQRPFLNARLALSHTGRAKRAMDLLIAIPALILCLPLFALIALAIALDSRGPVLFSQQRLGQGGKPFAIFKFRTMRVLEDGMHVVQACKNDVRITRIGSFLRSTSLDELPQLLNVVLGSMSLVGPRPHAVAHDKLYGALIADYSQRQRAKPGITGWAQINGARGATPTTEDMRKRVDLDIWYVDNANLILDLRILLRTPLEVLRQRNAY